MVDYTKCLWQNLELLGFDADHKIDTFLNRSDAKLVDRMIHFLFSKMSPKDSPIRFKGCWPVLDHIGNKDFRMAAFKWTIDLKETGLLPPDLPLRRSFLDDGYGEKFVMIVMWISVWALRKQASLENYAQVKYPASIYEPFACSTAEAKDELHNKYLPTQKEVFEKVLRTFQGKQAKFEAIISALEHNATRTESIEVLGRDVESEALNLLQQLEEKAEALAKLDKLDALNLKLSQEEAELQKAKSENERLKAELVMHSAEIFGTVQKKETHQAPAADSDKKERLVVALLAKNIFKTDKSNSESSHNPSILGSDLDADFLVR